MPEQQIIGTVQTVRLPGYSEQDIPAKIDTGADDSAIWATDIHEDDGELSFILFAPHSVFYTGEELKTTEYRLMRVKNSFGEREFRYKVKLALQVGKKTYRTSFNLADRSNNRYPILLGKKFLHKRFIVDVSQKDMVTPSAKQAQVGMVVLTSRLDQISREFFDEVARNMTDPLEVLHYKQLDYLINENGEPKILLPDGNDMAVAKRVYFKAHSLYPEQASAAARYLQYKHVPFMDSEVAHFVSRSKLTELFVLATNDVNVPQSRIVTLGRGDEMPPFGELKRQFGVPFVMKDAEGDRGKNNFLVSDKSSFEEAVDRLTDVRTIVIQKYIVNDGFLRILLMGDEVAQIVKRRTAEHADPLKAHLNKPHGGANAEELPESEWDSEAVALARKAALSLGREVAGVDLIEEKSTGKWYVLEVNYNPEVVSGKYAQARAKALAKFLEADNR